MTSFQKYPPEDEPKESDLPDRPQMEIPSEIEDPPEPEEVPEEEFLDPDVARDDHSIDDEEHDDPGSN